MTDTPTPAPAVILSAGSHDTREDGMCWPEYVAQLGGEEHTAWPKCACPVIVRFGQRINDNSTDEERQLLEPLAGRAVGTAGDGKQRERAYMCADWAVRTIAPMALESADEPELAATLRALPELVDRASALRARDVAREVRKKAASAYAASASAYAAYDAASAYAAYAASAYAASASAYAASAAASAYAASAYAASAYAASAARSAQARSAVWGSARELLDRMLPGDGA